jgi:hypothetical protein
MSNAELAYLCLTIGAFLFFGIGLAGAVAYSNGKPKEQDVGVGQRAHA